HTPNNHSLPACSHSGRQSNVPATLSGTQVPITRLATLNTNPVSNPYHFSSQNTNNAASTFESHDKISRSRNVKLPAFTGNSNDSWKVWFSRFTTVADLNNWDEATRLSELVQRLQGTAADFVFDEIPSEIIGNFQSLVHELGLRFQSVETNKTFRVQFGNRSQRIGESVEDYSAELKRIYDKAYPGRNPEMRRQLLLQQFLSGLRDRQAKFAVEYFKEPCTIEDAVHNVVTYMEAQQVPSFDSGRNRKSVRFYADAASDADNDDSSDNETNHIHSSRSLVPSNGRPEKQSIRKIKTTGSTQEPKSSCHTSDSLSKKEIDFIHCLVASAERETNEPLPNKPQVAPRAQGHMVKQGQMRPLQKNQGQNQGQNRFANVQCYHCSNFGHIKRDCPILQAEQNLNGKSESQRRASRPGQGVLLNKQGQVSQPSISLN
ncbi:MAG: zinc finger CCHC domain-containing protein, partial [Candidatus Thiodiazotropha sp.]